MITYNFRVTFPTNFTTKADRLFQLKNPTREELYATVRETLEQGHTSVISVRDSEEPRFFTHSDLVRLLSIYYGDK